MTSTEQRKILNQIEELVKQYFDSNKASAFVPGQSTVPLMEPSYSWQEVNQAIDSLLTMQLTLNQRTSMKVQEFEGQWSSYVGAKHGIMVNSGSSANLLALFALSNPTLDNPIRPGDEIITPAVTWHTTVSPIICVGAVPVLVDVHLGDATIDVKQIEAHITSKTRAIMPVHLLGNACDMSAIMELAKKHKLHVIEDVCEAHGSEFNGKRCGGIGTVGTFSFFFSHHITTIEGGMVTTSDEQLSELMRIMRSQGVIRNTERRKELEAEYAKTPAYRDLDPSYLFANLGFNLRPTQINGGFGLEQMKKIDHFLKQRRENHSYWRERLGRYGDFFHLPEERAGSRSAAFCFPMILRKKAPFGRTEMATFLNSKKIETRPIMAGNVAEQPAMKIFAHRRGELPNAQHIHERGFFWGNHQGILSPHREYIADCVDQFMSKYT